MMSRQRIPWIDVAKGFGIFLVVYGHNFPVTEKYIYSFHMPLFFMIAGFFHPENMDWRHIKKRFKALGGSLFFMGGNVVFVLCCGRKFGDSAAHHLSVKKTNSS